MAIEYVPVSTLKLHPKNPRIHPDSAIDKLQTSVSEYGWTNPILLSADGLVLAGHARIKAAEKLGLEKVPVIRLALTGAKADAYLIADNKTQQETMWDNAVLRELILELDTGEFDLGITGFDPKELEELLLVDGAPSQDNLMDISDDIGGAFALKDNMFFQSNEPYNIPELYPDMCAELPSDDIATWAGPDASEMGHEWYFYNYGSDSIRGLNLKKTILGFYVDDHRFEQAWERPAEFAGKLINRKLPIVLTPDYSVRVNDPEALQIWNCYRARWVGRYFQEAGITIIPSIQHAEERTFAWAFAGIPKGVSCIANQLHQEADVELKVLQIKGLRKMCEVLEPQSLLLYVGKDADEYITKGVPKDVKVVTVQSRVRMRAPVMRKAKQNKM